MEVTYRGVKEYDSKRGLVAYFNRTKRHKTVKYNYGQSMAPGDAEMRRSRGARRCLG